MLRPNVSVADFDYSLPEELIALTPTKDRGDSRLLVFRNGEIIDATFRDLHKVLPPNARLLFNDTQVVQARLPFSKPTGAAIEIFCLKPHDLSLEQALGAEGSVCWECLVGGSKKWKDGDVELNADGISITATRIAKEKDVEVVAFRWSPADVSFSEVLARAGQIPLPPYIDRDLNETDSQRYQTVYARNAGSVAAPTAGLHFTDEQLSYLATAGFSLSELTLHVGAGTFKPMTGSTAAEHDMHNEVFSFDRSLVKALASGTRPVVAVGTTSLRALESMYWLGVKAHSGDHDLFLEQWEPYQFETDLPVATAMEALLAQMDLTGAKTINASTSIMIVPGYRIRMAKGIITNFHLPKSTLLMLVAAAVGDNWKRIYEHALEARYRFLSFGDASLLLW